MKKPIFAGAGVAIVTPFKDKTLKINFPLFEELINEQIENGTDAIVVCGTTGEKSTLVYDEHLEAISKSDLPFKRYCSTCLNTTPLAEFDEEYAPLLDNEYIGICDHEQYFYADYLAYQPDYADKIMKM